MRKLALVLVMVACVEKGPTEPADPGYVKQNLLSAAPTPKRPLGAELGGKVVYLGADIDKESVKPGEKLTIVHYWKVNAPIGSDYRIFTHIDGATGKDWLNVDATKMRASYGPDQWKAGDLVRDEQTVTLKSDWSSPYAAIYIGMYKKGSSRDSDRLAVLGGPSDGKNRLLVARIQIGKALVQSPAGYVIRRAAGPITLDGKADEVDWSKAQSTGAFKDAEGGTPVGAETLGRLLWDDQNLYAFIDVRDPDVFSSYTKDDDSIWKEDVVELFIDANGDRHGYVELQVNPNNAHFDSWFEKTRVEGGDVTFSSGMKSAITVDGTKDNRGDEDQGWHAEIAIPLAAIKGKDGSMAVMLPPKAGQVWKLNLVRVEKGKDKPLTASSWAQISISDFHAIDRLLSVTFGDENGQTKPAAPAAPAPATAAPSAKSGAK